MGETQPDDVTQLLHRLASGDRLAENELLPYVYGELKRLAAAQLRKERAEHTLQTTALVHEAYLRLTRSQGTEWQDRLHFFAFAAKLMRRILVDHARTRNTGKRGGPSVQVPFDDALLVSQEQCELITGLDQALLQLAATDPRKAEVVELRFFAGLTEEEIADYLRISVRTVKRDWHVARAWLYGKLS